MDELAQAIGIEPLEFRLKNLKDTRLRAVFEAAAKAFGWGNKPPKEHGFGIRNNFPKWDQTYRIQFLRPLVVNYGRRLSRKN